MTTPIRLASDSDVHRYTMAALSWLLQDHDGVAESYVSALNREDALTAWHKVNALQAKLAARHAYLAEVAVAEPVPDGVDGYPIGGRRCPWCGLDPCPDLWLHERNAAASETAWRQR